MNPATIMVMVICLLLLGSHCLWSDEPDLAQLVRALSDPNSEVRSNAVQTLGSMKSRAALALPALRRALAAEEQSQTTTKNTASIAAAIAAIEEDVAIVVPALIREGANYIVSNWSKEARVELRYAVFSRSAAQIGPRAMPILLTLLADGDDRVRWLAIESLAAIESQDETVIAAITKMLEDPEISVRCKAAITLGEIGTPAAKAIPALLTAFSDPKNNRCEDTHFFAGVGDNFLSNACFHAAIALGTIGAQGEHGQKIIPAFINALGNPDTYLAEFALIGLEYFGIHAAPAVPAIQKLLHCPEPTVRLHAVKTLGAIGEPAAPAIPDLGLLLADKYRHLYIRHSALRYV